MFDVKKEEYAKYLFSLQASESINMFGAAPYLELKFDLSKQQAKEVLLYWLENWEDLYDAYGVNESSWAKPSRLFQNGRKS